MDEKPKRELPDPSPLIVIAYLCAIAIIVTGTVKWVSWVWSL